MWRSSGGLAASPTFSIALIVRMNVPGLISLHNTTEFLRKFGITTALQFATKEESFIKKHFSKPYREIWQELNGRSVYSVVTESRSSYQSISKAKTFTPPSGDETFIFAQLSKNLENACIKARRHGLAATRLVLFLRTQDFRDYGMEIKFSRPTAFPAELFEPLREGFKHVFREGILYRLTGVFLAGLRPEDKVQYSLFDDTARMEKMSRVYSAIDTLSERFGKHTVYHGSSLPTKTQAQHEGDRGDVPRRKADLFMGENKRQRLGLPLLKMKV